MTHEERLQAVKEIRDECRAWRIYDEGFPSRLCRNCPWSYGHEEKSIAVLHLIRKTHLYFGFLEKWRREHDTTEPAEGYRIYIYIATISAKSKRSLPQH